MNCFYLLSTEAESWKNIFLQKQYICGKNARRKSISSIRCMEARCLGSSVAAGTIFLDTTIIIIEFREPVVII